MTISLLLTRAHVRNWDRASWFRGARLTGSVLSLPADADHVAFVERNWGAAFRREVPGLRIEAQPADPAWVRDVLNAKGKRAYRGQMRTAAQRRLVD